MGSAFVGGFASLDGLGMVTLMGVDGLEPEAVVPLLGVPGREPDLRPDAGRLTGAVGREVFVPQPSLMMLRACPALAGGEALTLLGTALSGCAGWEVENPVELGWVLVAPALH
jgi:hypothetical protein